MFHLSIVLILSSFLLDGVNCQAKGAKAEAKAEEKPMPYNFKWQVNEKDAKPSGSFFEHNEKIDEANLEKTEGEYRVWLPDGRLMIVSYYVDGESGFVPTITYEDNHVPAWKTRK